MYYKKIFYPKYGNNFYDALEYTRVLSAVNNDTKNKYDCENERWVPEIKETPTDALKDSQP
jgi:hypothetical protein